MFVCVAGKNNISVSVLQYLIEHNLGRYELGVVCNKTETGEDSWQKSLRKYAKEQGIQEYKLSEIYEKTNQIFLSMEYDRIVKTEKFLDARLFNIHFSLLPKYRGMYTSVLPLLHGDKQGGVTLHYIDNGIDTGDIVAQSVVPIEYEDTSRDLYLKYMEHGTRLVLANLENILAGKEKAKPQAKEGATYYSKKTIDYSNLQIDLERTADEIRNQIRAFCFREYQLPKIYGRKITGAKITDIRSGSKPGTIIKETEKMMEIASIDYNVELYFDEGATREKCNG